MNPSSPGGSTGGTPPWRDRFAAARHIPAFLRLVWRTHRGYAAAIVALRLARALVPVAMLYVGKLIINQVVAGVAGAGADLPELARLVALEIGLAVAGEVLARSSAVVEGLLGDLFSNDINVRLMEHAASLSLEQFEDPKFYDHLERARQQTAGRIGLLSQLLAVGQDLLTLCALSAVLVAYSPVLALLLALAVLPRFIGETHFAGLQYSLLFRWTPQNRELAYLRYVGASAETAKEVQMFGLAPWLTRRYRVLAGRFYQDNRRLAIRKGIGSSLFALMGTAGYYTAYVVVLFAAARGEISVGQLTLLAGSFAQGRDAIQRLLLGASDIFEKSLYLRDLFTFLEVRPSIASRLGARPVPEHVTEGFRFEDVGFRYPGGDRWAVRHVSFAVRPGECVALVGENGAGKTTVTKLLARLYDPSEGRITLDGVDLRDYDLASLRRAIGVIFQDFVRYDMRFDENIGVGRIDAMGGYMDLAADAEPGAVPPVPDPIHAAAERSLAASLLPRLAGGYRQMLGRYFDGGVELSGGEWQKVALARAYMRGAEVLILDEPTAALDARAEFEVFQRFTEITRGRMAVVISHRFSTVRMADRIVVLGGGAVEEEGSHEELLQTGGAYSELFGMQAAGYR